MEGKKNKKKTAATVLLVVGIVILVLSLAADPLGIGGNPVFGRNQIIGTIVGAIVTVVGLILRLRK
ncbi:MAG: hypothetical protein KAX24_05505 [Anaerolineae bacterium]|nr:hypothetical protein [Anaerolineae bacterium]